MEGPRRPPCPHMDRSRQRWGSRHDARLAVLQDARPAWPCAGRSAPKSRGTFLNHHPRQGCTVRTIETRRLTRLPCGRPNHPGHWRWTSKPFPARSATSRPRYGQPRSKWRRHGRAPRQEDNAPDRRRRSSDVKPEDPWRREPPPVADLGHTQPASGYSF